MSASLASAERSHTGDVAGVRTEPRPPAPASRLAEFFLVGGATPLLFALAWVLRRWLGLDEAELVVGFVMFHAAFVINDPHFAVTYSLFYRDFAGRAFAGSFGPGLRARYVVAGIAVPIALAAWAVTALAMKSAVGLGLLIQLMFLLVGWHYVKQGFGVMVVLAARRGCASLAASGWRCWRTRSRGGRTRGRTPPIRGPRSRRRASSSLPCCIRRGSSG